MSERAYLFNDAEFAFEVIDDEVIALNLREGVYYAFGGWVLDIWEDLGNRQPVAQFVDRVASRYVTSADIVEADLDAFIGKLIEEEILLAAEPSDEPAVYDGGEPTGEFRPISFEKHTDMQALLTLDPLHDVDLADGWPKPRQI